MGTLAIIICGLIGAGSGVKKDFSQCWIFLVNLSFSLYVAILVNPLVVSLLDIPGLPQGYKTSIALGVVFLLMDFILKKIVEQIWSDPDMSKILPELPAKIGSLIAGFFSGTLIAAIVLLCFVQTPFSEGISVRQSLQSASGNTMLILVRTMNGLSWQWGATAKMSQLNPLGIVPAEKNGKAPKTAGKPAADPDKKPEGTVSADGQKKEGKTPDTAEKPADNSGKKLEGAVSDGGQKKD